MTQYAHYPTLPLCALLRLSVDALLHCSHSVLLVGGGVSAVSARSSHHMSSASVELIGNAPAWQLPSTTPQQVHAEVSHGRGRHSPQTDTLYCRPTLTPPLLLCCVSCISVSARPRTRVV